MRAVNCDVVVVVKWTDAEDSGVLIKFGRYDLRNQEAAIIRRGIPNGLRINDDIIRVENVSIITLRPFCAGALSEDNADSFAGRGMTTTFASLGPSALERSIVRRAGFNARVGILECRRGTGFRLQMARGH